MSEPIWHRCVDTPPPTDRRYRVTDGTKLYFLNPASMFYDGDPMWTENDCWADGWTDSDE